MVTDYFLRKLNGLSVDSGKSLEDLTDEYKVEYQRVLVNVQVRMGYPLTDLLSKKHYDQYFALCRRIGDVAFDRVRQNYVDVGWTSTSKKHISRGGG